MKRNRIQPITYLSILLLSFIFFSGCKSKKIAGMHSLQVVVMNSSEYCGGAAPSEEMLKEMSTPKILPNSQVYFVKRNDEGVVISELPFTTDSKGRLNIQLAPDHYYVYTQSQKQLEESISKMAPEHMDCTRQFMHQSAFDLPVFEDMDTKIMIHTRCNPCLPPAP